MGTDKHLTTGENNYRSMQRFRVPAFVGKKNRKVSGSHMSNRSLKLSGAYHILLTHYEMPDLLNERFRLFVWNFRTSPVKFLNTAALRC